MCRNEMSERLVYRVVSRIYVYRAGGSVASYRQRPRSKDAAAILEARHYTRAQNNSSSLGGGGRWHIHISNIAGLARY